MTIRAAVFASGRGSNFQVLADRFPHRPISNKTDGIDEAGSECQVVLLVTDRDQIQVLDRARDRNIPTTVIPPGNDPVEFEGRLLDRLKEAEVDIVLLAGYLRLIPPAVVRRYNGRMLNLHPALLPAFGGPGMYGRRVYEEVLSSGIGVTGITVHFVDEEYDRGPILAQWPIPVLSDDTPDDLATRTRKVEHILYPAAVEALVRSIATGTPPAEIPRVGGYFHLTSSLPEFS